MYFLIRKTKWEIVNLVQAIRRAEISCEPKDTYRNKNIKKNNKINEVIKNALKNKQENIA